MRCVLGGIGWAGALAAIAVAGETASIPVANATSGKPLRELSTDRPDVTESPFTVDVGHVQIEADFFSHLRTKSPDERVREWSLGTTNLRFGVGENVEAGIFIPPWTRRVTEPAGPGQPRVVESGFGDLTLRGKVNFLGNDGGPSPWV